MKNNNLAQVLKEKQVFRKFPASELTLLAEHSLRRRLSEEEYLCRQGERWPYVVFLHDGRLRWVMLS